MSSAEASAAGPQSPRYQSLDVWRGVACLMVVFAHCLGEVPHDGPAPSLRTPLLWALRRLSNNLYLGVPFFFVISGYCIAATAEGTLRRGRGMATYFKRRLRRIFPPYLIVCALSVALIAVFTALGLVRLLTEGNDCFPQLGQLTPWQWLGPRGSSPGARNRFWWGVTVITLGTIVTATLSALTGDSLAGFFFDGRFLIFASGLVVYYCLHRGRGPWKRALPFVLALIVLAGAVLRYGSIAPRITRDQRVWLFEILCGAVFALVLIYLHRWDAPMMKSRALAPLRYCGRMCYSLYLVHWPITILLSHELDRLGVKGLPLTYLTTVPLGTAASVVAARLFYLRVEKPFLNPPQATAPPTPRVSAPGAGST